MIKITIIGGGTGTFVVASGLKQFDEYQISKIVTVFDSGGSTGRLRDEFGFLPVGDIRQSLAAIAKENDHSWIRQLMLYRFEKGTGLKGHNLGNLILTALQDMTGSTPEALEVAAKIFRLRGRVYPVTTKTVDLKITYQDGSVQIGEHTLDDMSLGGRPIKNIGLSQPCKIYSQAQKAILEADYIIIGPGDLYASILPNFIVNGARPALQKTKAKIIYITNLMTRYTQTHGFTAQDHVDTITEYIGRPIDVVLVNSGKISPKIKAKYALQKEYPVINNLSPDSPYTIVADNFASSITTKQNPSDTVPRSLMRHNQKKIISALRQIIQ